MPVIVSEHYRQDMLNLPPRAFIATLGHDMANRINAVLGATELLADELRDETLNREDIDKLIGIILKSTQDLRTLASLALDYEDASPHSGPALK